MDDEYWITRNDDTGGLSFRALYHRSQRDRQRGPIRFGTNEVDLRNLSRDFFDYLGEWGVLRAGGAYGLAYRMGVKDGLTDSEGDPMELYLHFGCPVSRKGHTITPEQIEDMHGYLITTIALVTRVRSLARPNTAVVSIELDPPEYMIRELDAALRAGNT